MRAPILAALLLLTACRDRPPEPRPEPPTSAVTSKSSAAPAVPPDPNSPEGQLLQFAREAGQLHVCDLNRKDPSCQDRARVAWLDEHVDWEVKEAIDLVGALKGGHPEAQALIGNEAPEELKHARDTDRVAHRAAGYGPTDPNDTCTARPASAKEEARIRPDLDAKPPAVLSKEAIAALTPFLDRAHTIKKAYALHCGRRTFLFGWQDGARAPIVPLPGAIWD